MMLAGKNGLRSVWRSPGKTVLFFLLLLALSAVLALGLCIYSAVDGYLDDCDDYFRIIANLEYIGHDYNDSTVYDEELAQALDTGVLQLETMQALPGAVSWEAARSALGIPEGFERADMLVRDQQSAILIVSNLSWEELGEAYQGYVGACLYSFKENTGKGVFISPAGLGELAAPNALDLSETRTYVFSGRYMHGENSFLWFLPEPMEVEVDGEMVVLPACAPVPDGGLPEDSPYHVAARAIRTRNNGLRVRMTRDLESLLPFQQQELRIERGRGFTEAEYAEGAKVCVLSGQLAAAMGKNVGDSLDLALYYNVGAGVYDAVHTGGEPDTQGRYQIVGVFNSENSYGDWIFVPDSAAYMPDVCPTGYTVGQFRLENDQAAQFYAQASALLPAGFRLTVYDQGYAATAAPFQELLRIARIFLAVCCLVILAVLCLFGYLFVYRQRDAAQTMLALGSGKGHVHAYFAAGAASISLPSTLLGALLSVLLERRVLAFVADFAARYDAADLRYSSANLTVTRPLAFAPQTPAVLFLLAALLLAEGVLLACALFAGSAMAQRTQRKRRRAPRAPRRPAHSSHLSGSLKYPILSIRRGGARTGIVVAVALAVTLFLSQLAATAGNYERQLDAIEENTTIRGYATDAKGLVMDNLTLRLNALQSLYDTGLLAGLDIGSGGSHYRLEGIRSDPDGTERLVTPTRLPTTSFAKETLAEQMAAEPELVSTTSLTNAPEFYYSAGPDITWLAGYDERCFRGQDTAICVAPQPMMQREGIGLGSTIRIFVCYPSEYTKFFYSLDLLVVGSYVPQGAGETLYSPLSYTFPRDSEPGLTVERDPLPVPDGNGYRHGETPVCIADFADGIFGDGTALHFQYAGFGAADFLQAKIPACLVSTERMADEGLTYGDSVLIADANGYALEYTLVGSFEKTAGLWEIYCTQPIPYNQPMTSTYSGELGPESLQHMVCESAIFSLRSTADMGRLKDALTELGYSELHDYQGSRSYIILDDRDYNSTVSSLQRQIHYIDALYTCLYVLTGLIGLTVAYLLVASRKREAATMRGLGAQRLRIFSSFFLEQLFLAALGCTLGLGLWALLGRPCTRTQLLLTAIFLACWAVGAAAGMLRQLRSKALAALSDRE